MLIGLGVTLAGIGLKSGLEVHFLPSPIYLLLIHSGLSSSLHCCTLTVAQFVLLNKLYSQTVFDTQFDPMKHRYFEIGPPMHIGCRYACHTAGYVSDWLTKFRMFVVLISILDTTTILRGYMRDTRGYGWDT